VQRRGCARRSGCSKGGCGGSSAFNNRTAAGRHELGEAVTDVQVGNATAFAPPFASISDQTGEEVGDLCNQQQAQITAGGHTYTLQKLWSNLQNACVTTPAQYLLNSATNAVPGQPFNVSVTATAPETGGAALQLYDHTVHFTSSDQQAALPADYTFAPATDSGSHIFTVTLNSLGSQTLTATDTISAVITASAAVSVNHNPDLTVTLKHSGNFTQGQKGATYTLTVGNGATGRRARRSVSASCCPRT